MDYCTQQDMTNRFNEKELIQITDANNVGAINADKLSRAIADASAVIDSYIGARYTLPLSVVPGVLVNYACDITRYKLYEDRVTETIEKRNKEAIDWLIRVANGKATLGIDEATADNVGGSVKVAQGESKIGWEAY